MKFNDLIQAVTDLAVFDLPTLLCLSGGNKATMLNQLSRWTSAGKIQSLRRGLYTLSDPYRRASFSPLVLANQLYRPSYLSGLWALGFYGLIPEKVVIYSSVTTRVTRSFANAWGTFHYSNLKQDFFWGFGARDIEGHQVWIADPEKALLDYWHLQPKPWTLERMAEMRFQTLDMVGRRKLNTYARKWNSRRLLNAVVVWEQLVKEEAEGGMKL